MKYQPIIGGEAAELKQVRFDLPGGKVPGRQQPEFDKQQSEVSADQYHALIAVKNAKSSQHNIFEQNQRLSDFSLLAHSYSSQSLPQNRPRTSIGVLGQANAQVVLETLNVGEDQENHLPNKSVSFRDLSTPLDSAVVGDHAQAPASSAHHQKAGASRKKSRNNVGKPSVSLRRRHTTASNAPLKKEKEAPQKKDKGRGEQSIGQRKKSRRRVSKKRGKKAAGGGPEEGTEPPSHDVQKQKNDAKLKYKVSEKGVQMFNVQIANDVTSDHVEFQSLSLASEKGRNQDRIAHSFRQQNKVEQAVGQDENQYLPQEPLTHRVVSNRQELGPQEAQFPANSQRNDRLTQNKKRGSEPHVAASRNVEQYSLQSESLVPRHFIASKVVLLPQTDRKAHRIHQSRNLQTEPSAEWQKSKEEKLKRLNEELSDLKNFISRIGKRSEPQQRMQHDQVERSASVEKRLQMQKQKNVGQSSKKVQSSSKVKKRAYQKTPANEVSNFERMSQGCERSADSESKQSHSDHRFKDIIAQCYHKFRKGRGNEPEEKGLKERPWQQNMKKGVQGEKTSKEGRNAKRGSLIQQPTFDINMLSKNIPKPKISSKKVSCLELNDMSDRFMYQSALAAQTQKHSSPRISGRKITRDHVVVKTSPEMGTHQAVISSSTGQNEKVAKAHFSQIYQQQQDVISNHQNRNLVQEKREGQQSHSGDESNYDQYDLPRQIERVEKFTRELNRNKQRVEEREKRMSQYKDAFIITFNQNCEINNQQDEQALSGYQRVRQISGQGLSKQKQALNNNRKKSRVQFTFSESQKRRSRTPDMLPFGRFKAGQHSAEEILCPYSGPVNRRRSESTERQIVTDKLAQIQKLSIISRARSVSPSETNGILSRNNLSRRQSHQSHENKRDVNYLSLPRVIRNNLFKGQKSSQESIQQNKKKSGSNARITPSKGAKKQANADLARVNSIVRGNLKKHQEIDKQRMEDQFLQALQHQDKLQRMRKRNQEIRKKNEEQASRSRSRSRSRSPKVNNDGGSPASLSNNNKHKGYKLKRQLMEKYSYNKLRQLEQKQKMIDDMKQKPLNLKLLAKNVVEPPTTSGNNVDGQDLDPNYSDVQEIVLTSRYKQLRAVHTHREKVAESAQLIMKIPGQEKSIKDKVVTLEVVSSKSEAQDQPKDAPRGEGGASQKMKQNLEQLVLKQKLRRQELERIKRQKNEEHRNRISENLKKLETDIEKLKSREQKRSKSQRKQRNQVRRQLETEKRRSKSPEKEMKERAKEAEKQHRSIQQKKKLQPNNKNYSLQVCKNAKHRKKSPSPGDKGARSESNVGHEFSQIEVVGSANDYDCSSNQFGKRLKKVQSQNQPFFVKNQQPLAKSASKSKSGSRSRSKSPNQGNYRKISNSRINGNARSRSGSPSPHGPAHKQSHPYLSQLAGQRAYYSQQISHRGSNNNLKNLNTRQKIKQIIHNQKQIMQAKLKMVERVRRVSPQQDGVSQVTSNVAKSSIATKSNEMVSLQALALNLFNLSEQQLKLDRKEKQRKRAAQERSEAPAKKGQAEAKQSQVDHQILNLDLKSMHPTRNTSKEELKTVNEGLDAASKQNSSNEQMMNPEKMYRHIQLKEQRPKIATEQAHLVPRSPKFKDLSVNQDEMTEFQPYENLTPASSKKSINSIIPTQIFSIPEGQSSVTLFPKQVNNFLVPNRKEDLTPPDAGPKGVDVTQTSMQSDIVGRFESSEAVAKQKTFIQQKNIIAAGKQSQPGQEKNAPQKSHNDIKAKIKDLLQDQQSFEVIVTLNNAAIKIQKFYRKHLLQKQRHLKQKATPLRNSFYQRPLSLTPLSLPRHYQQPSSMRSPSVDVNIQSSIMDQVEERPTRGIELGIMVDHIGHANAGNVIQTHREPISNNNSGIKGMRTSRVLDRSEQEDDLAAERRVNQTEQRGNRTESKRDLELAGVPASAAIEHRGQKFFETSLPTEEVDLTSRIELIDEAISQARQQDEIVHTIEEATDQMMKSEEQLLNSMPSPDNGTADHRRPLLSVVHPIDSRQSPQSVLIGDGGERIQTISVVGSIVDVLGESRSNQGGLGASKQIKTARDVDRKQLPKFNVQVQDDDELDDVASDFDMKQFEIQSLCEMIQSEMSSDAKDLKKQQLKQRKVIKRHLEKIRLHKLELNDVQVPESEAKKKDRRAAGKDDELKTEEVIQQISLRSLNIDGLDSNNGKLLEFTAAQITSSPDDDQHSGLLKQSSFAKSPETPRDKVVQKYPSKLEPANLERPPHTSRNEYHQAPHLHRHIVSDQKSSQFSINFQNIQSINRPSVDSKFMQKDVARISKISKNQGDNPTISQQISQRSLINHAKNLFPDDPAFAQIDKLSMKNQIKNPSLISKIESHKTNNEVVKEDQNNLEQSLRSQGTASFEEQRVLQIKEKPAEASDQHFDDQATPTSDKKEEWRSEHGIANKLSQNVKEEQLKREVPALRLHAAGQDVADQAKQQQMESQPSVDHYSIKNESFKILDSSGSKVSKSFYQNVDYVQNSNAVQNASPPGGQQSNRSSHKEADVAAQISKDQETFMSQSRNLDATGKDVQKKQSPLGSDRESRQKQPSLASPLDEPRTGRNEQAEQQDQQVAEEPQQTNQAQINLNLAELKAPNVQPQQQALQQQPEESVPTKPTFNAGENVEANIQGHSGKSDGQELPDGQQSIIKVPTSSPLLRATSSDQTNKSFERQTPPPSFRRPQPSPKNQNLVLHQLLSPISTNKQFFDRTQAIRPTQPFRNPQLVMPTTPVGAVKPIRTEDDAIFGPKQREVPRRQRPLLSKTQKLLSPPARRRAFNEPHPRVKEKSPSSKPPSSPPDSHHLSTRKQAPMSPGRQQMSEMASELQLEESGVQSQAKIVNVYGGEYEDERVEQLPAADSGPHAPPKNWDLNVKEDSIVAGGVMSGRTSSSHQESWQSNAISQGTLERRREIGEELEKMLGEQIIHQDIDQMFSKVLKRQIEPAKEQKAEKYNEKIPSAKESQQQEEIPEQISLKQAQIQKELDELQQLQGKREGKDKAEGSSGQPNIEKQQSPGSRKQKESQQLIAGIDTSLETVESYVEDIFQQIRERGPQFLNAFLTPIYHQPLDELHIIRQAQTEYQLHGTQGSFYRNMFENEQLNASLLCILNVQLYLTLEKERESVIKEAIEQIKQQSDEEINEEELADMISEADHIHNKAIFDAVNEAMNLVRPYGKQGEPMPWSQQGRKNSFMQVQDNIHSIYKTLERVLHQVKYYVLSWANTRAGSIQHSLDADHDSKTTSQENQIRKILNDQEQQKIIEEIISSEIVEMQNQEQEQQWREPNERFMAQVKMELADHVFSTLISETITCLNGIQTDRSHNEAPVKREEK